MTTTACSDELTTRMSHVRPPGATTSLINNDGPGTFYTSATGGAPATVDVLKGNEQPFRFIDLPPELRNYIYGYSASHSPKLIGSRGFNLQLWASRFCPTDLLLVSRSVRQEAEAEISHSTRIMLRISGAVGQPVDYSTPCSYIELVPSVQRNLAGHLAQAGHFTLAFKKDHQREHCSEGNKHFSFLAPTLLTLIFLQVIRYVLVKCGPGFLATLPRIRAFNVALICGTYDLDRLASQPTTSLCLQASHFFKFKLENLLPDADIHKPTVKFTKTMLLQGSLNSVNLRFFHLDTDQDTYREDTIRYVLDVLSDGWIIYRATLASEDGRAWAGVHLQTVASKARGLEGAMARIDSVKQKWRATWDDSPRWLDVLDLALGRSGAAMALIEELL
jgi:hypothetical protein